MGASGQGWDQLPSSGADQAAGSTGLTITVNGSGFVASSAARWDGASRPTTVVSATQLRFDVSASDLATTFARVADDGASAAARP